MFSKSRKEWSELSLGLILAAKENTHSEVSTAHLVAAFLQQTLHKLPVGLGNH